MNAVSGSWIENKLYQNDLYILCNKRQPFNLPLIILWLVGESNICKQNRLHVLHIIIISNNFITFWIYGFGIKTLALVVSRHTEADILINIAAFSQLDREFEWAKMEIMTFEVNQVSGGVSVLLYCTTQGRSYLWV